MICASQQLASKNLIVSKGGIKEAALGPAAAIVAAAGAQAAVHATH